MGLTWGLQEVYMGCSESLRGVYMGLQEVYKGFTGVYSIHGLHGVYMRFAWISTEAYMSFNFHGPPLLFLGSGRGCLGSHLRLLACSGSGAVPVALSLMAADDRRVLEAESFPSAQATPPPPLPSPTPPPRIVHFPC